MALGSFGDSSFGNRAKVAATFPFLSSKTLRIYRV